MSFFDRLFGQEDHHKDPEFSEALLKVIEHMEGMYPEEAHLKNQDTNVYEYQISSKIQQAYIHQRKLQTNISSLIVADQYHALKRKTDQK